MWVKGNLSNPSGNCVSMWVKGDQSISVNCVAMWAKGDHSGATECVAFGCDSTACVQMTIDENGMCHFRDTKESTAGTELLIPAADCDSGKGLRFAPIPLVTVPLALRLVVRAQGKQDDQLQWYRVRGIDAATGQPARLYFHQDEKDAWEKSESYVPI